MDDYSKDLKPAKWGSGLKLHSSNFKRCMSPMGHVWTAPWQELSDLAAALVGCGHAVACRALCTAEVDRLCYTASGTQIA
jgi:hypothetical protein